MHGRKARRAAKEWVRRAWPAPYCSPPPAAPAAASTAAGGTANVAPGLQAPLFDSEAWARRFYRGLLSAWDASLLVPAPGLPPSTSSPLQGSTPPRTPPSSTPLQFPSFPARPRSTAPSSLLVLAPGLLSAQDASLLVPAPRLLCSPSFSPSPLSRRLGRLPLRPPSTSPLFPSSPLLQVSLLRPNGSLSSVSSSPLIARSAPVVTTAPSLPLRNLSVSVSACSCTRSPLAISVSTRSYSYPLCLFPLPIRSFSPCLPLSLSSLSLAHAVVSPSSSLSCVPMLLLCMLHHPPATSPATVSACH